MNLMICDSDISLSPSHTHVRPIALLTSSHPNGSSKALIALQTGDIKTYDLLNCQLSPYTIPSLWRLKDEEIIQASEMLCSDLVMS